jgi:hypothetical protein
MFSAPEAVLTTLPTKVDLTSKMPQGLRPGPARQLHGERDRRRVRVRPGQAGLQDFMPSRLFIYYNERAMEGTIDTTAAR